MGLAMTSSLQGPPRHGSQSASARDGDRRRDGGETHRSSEGPVSDTIRKAPPMGAHITHALNIAIAQLQNAQEMMADADPHVAIGQLNILRAIVVRLRPRA